jgi:hypothetical protein
MNGQQITWIQVPRPTFDLVGVLVSSLSFTGIMAGVALALGIGLGIALIRRRDREGETAFAERVSLGLANAASPHLLADAAKPR